MTPPQVWPWFNTLEVAVNVDIGAEVHVGVSHDFTPGPDTYRGVLLGPGAFHVIGTPTGVDLYARLVGPAGDVSEAVGPVQTLALTS